MHEMYTATPGLSVVPAMWAAGHPDEDAAVPGWWGLQAAFSVGVFVATHGLADMPETLFAGAVWVTMLETDYPGVLTRRWWPANPDRIAAAWPYGALPADVDWVASATVLEDLLFESHGPAGKPA